MLTTKDAASFYMVLVPGSHSVQIIEVERATGIFGNDTSVLRVDGFKEKFRSLSITDAANYCVQRVRGVLLGGDGGEDGQIGIEVCSERVPLLLHSLRERKEFSVWSLQLACDLVTPETEPAQKCYSRLLLLQRLVAAAARDEYEAIIAAYKKPAKTAENEDEDGVEPDDEELVDLLEEMAISDQVNAQDVKSYVNEVKSKTIKKLSRMRKAARESKAKAAEERKQKKKRKKAPKKRKTKLRGQLHKISNSVKGSAASAPTPAQPAPSAAPAAGAPWYGGGWGGWGGCARL